MPGSSPGTTGVQLINNNGQVLGSYVDAANGITRSFIYSDGTYNTFDLGCAWLGSIDACGGAPIGSNDADQIIGYVSLGVPEPSTWAMMLLGFAFVGLAFRRSRRRISFA